ncbi:hypothetical protein GmRootA79_46770 [Acidovorax sp. A79]|uniref:hypothetical protein n=1 Tax=Acidovorax sp. A79 TaxID=3056107 RepID=UPI0034E8969A
MTTKKRKKKQGTAGGAAVAAGAGFQERVAAFAMVHALIGGDGFSVLSLGTGQTICSIHLETAQAIDDIVLRGEQFRVLIQAKRSVSLSEAIDSPFSKAIAQFVHHHETDWQPGDRYALATARRSSDRVTFDLRKLTESVRLNAQALVSDPLTEAEQEVLGKTRKLISHHLRELRQSTVEDEAIDEILRCIWVLPFDLEDGGSDEALALVLLKSRSIVEPKLVWASLLELASTLAGRRGSVDLAGLRERVGQLIKPEGEKKVAEDEFRLPVQQMNSVAAGKEVVVIDGFCGTEGITVAEFYRFAEDGKRRLTFTDDGYTHFNGAAHKVLYRAATIEGTRRYFDANKASVAGRKVVLWPYGGKDNPNESPWAKAHRALLEGLIQRNRHLLRCVVCGDPVSENKALVAEVDEEDVELAVGYVHQRCHRPSLRVLGEIRSELFAEFAVLTDFDYEAWVLANRLGPSLISQSPGRDGIAYAAWNAAPTGTGRGTWCVRFNLEDGSSSYATERARVVRLGREEALQYAAEMSESFAKAIKARNPWCYTSDREIYGTYSSIAPRLKPGQRLLKCVNAEVAQFTAAIEIAYSSKRNHYTPLVVLMDLETGRPLDIQGPIPLISDPFQLSTFLENWSAAGIEVPPYAVAVVAEDRDFDMLVTSSFERGFQVVIDPLVDMRGNPLRGFVVTPTELIAASKPVEDA